VISTLLIDLFIKKLEILSSFQGLWK
jgi:hypothetical protein